MAHTAFAPAGHGAEAEDGGNAFPTAAALTGQRMPNGYKMTQSDYKVSHTGLLVPLLHGKYLKIRVKISPVRLSHGRVGGKSKLLTSYILIGAPPKADGLFFFEKPPARHCSVVATLCRVPVLNMGPTPQGLTHPGVPARTQAGAGPPARRGCSDPNHDPSRGGRFASCTEMGRNV